MNPRHFYKLSYAVLYVLLALILVVGVLFFAVGYDNPVSDYNCPQNTDLLLCLTYGMLCLSLLAAAGAVVFQLAHAWSQSRRRMRRLLAGTGAFAVLLLLAWAFADDAPMVINGRPYAEAVWLKAADMLLYAVYALLGVAVVCVILAAAGVFRRIGLKR